jgi:hypothetical protein
MTVEEYHDKNREDQLLKACPECSNEQLTVTDVRQFCNKCGWSLQRYQVQKQVNPHGLSS